MKSFAKLPQDLEKPPMSLSCALFMGLETTPLYEVVIDGKEVCLVPLAEFPQQPVLGKQFPPTLHIQLDNCTNDNKC